MRFHERIASREIRCTFRIGQRPPVKVEGRYALGADAVVLDAIEETSVDGAPTAEPLAEKKLGLSFRLESGYRLTPKRGGPAGELVIQRYA